MVLYALIIYNFLIIAYIIAVHKYKFSFKEYFIYLKNRKRFKKIKEKEEIFVYRLEYLNGIGPYRNKDILNYSEEINPTPYNDFKENLYLHMKYSGKIKKYKFGFETIEDLNNWFPKEQLDELMKIGYKVKKFSTKKYIKGNKQLMFIPINEIDMLTIKD